jgi:ABC-type dipeptide/oligopeptide/nickel transport system permease subunit
LKKNWSLWSGLLMFSVLLFFAFFADQLSFVDPSPAESRMRFYDDGSMARAPFPPSKEDPLGTDSDGRDLLSLLIIGTKDTLRYIFLIAFIRYIIAIPLAFLAAPKKGLAHFVVNGWDSLFSSVPTIFSAIILLMLPEPVWNFSQDTDYKVYWAILLLALMEVGRVSMIVSHEIHEIGEKEYVKAGIMIGNSPLKMYIHYYFPNIFQNLIVNFCNDLGRVTLLIGQLALFSIFISTKVLMLEGGVMDISSAAYDWQSLLEKSRSDIIRAIWIPLVPAVAITYTIFTFNLLGEGLRQRFNIFKSSSDISIRERFKKVNNLVLLPFKKYEPARLILVFLIGAGTGILLSASIYKPEPVQVTQKAETNIQTTESIDISKSYEKEGDLLVPITKSTTKLGGLYDDVDYIKTNMPLKDSTNFPVFETEKVKLVCMNSINQCVQPIVYFKQPIRTEGEAMQALKDHLPQDTKIISTLSLEQDKVYNVTSELFKNSYPLEYQGGMSITFKYDDKKWIFAATIRMGHKKEES